MDTCFKTVLVGTKLQAALPARRQRASRMEVVAMAGTKKVNSYDENWSKGFFTSGYFLEDSEASSKSAFKKIEDKKLLSSVEKMGLLSKLDKAGLTLSKIESSKLLSTAENLGLLSLAEDVLTGNPATLASGALPFVVLAILSASLIPHDSGLTTALSYTLATAFTGVGAGLLVGGFVVAAIQEE